MEIGGGGSPLAEVRGLRNAYLEGVEGIDLEALEVAWLGEHIKDLQVAVDLLELQKARAVAVLDRELPEPAIDWLKKNTKVSGASADKMITLARQLPELEATVEALELGQIGFEHALVIARESRDLPEAAEAEMLEAAQKADPQVLRQVAARIRHREDPEEANLRAYRQFQKRRLRLFQFSDGMLGLEGALPAPEGMKLRVCLESLVGVPEKGDERTQEQRQADALVELCSVGIASGKLPRLGGRAPQLTVIVRSEGAELEGVGPIAEGTLSRLLAQDHLERRQVVDSRGVTLDFGRARRLHSEPQRQELATRYPCCVVEGCDVPARRCQPHHLKPWALGGGTGVKEAVPLCWKHHPLVTEGGWRLMAREGGGFALCRSG